MENDPPPHEVVTRDGVTYRIRRLTEVSQILPRLEKDRVFCAYALCQLEPERFSHTRWYLAEGDSGEALVMHSTGSLRGPVLGFGADLFCLGDPEPLNVILSLHPGPRFVRLWAQVEHGPILRRHFRLVRDSPVLLFRNPSEAEVGPIEPPVRRLSSADIQEINRLFRSEGVGLYRAAFIDRGLWYGYFEDGLLVAVSSYETISPTYGVALDGRALTHPKYRGRHYMEPLTASKRRGTSGLYPLRVHKVDPANQAMMRIRSRLGRSPPVGQVLETTAYRRDPVGLASLIRRVLARRRATKSAT